MPRKPPVASTSGLAACRRRRAETQTSPARATSASVSPRGSKRRPTVSGLPVSRPDHRRAQRPRASRAPSSSRSKTSRWSSGSPPGHSARNSSKTGSARRSRSRAASSRRAGRPSRARRRRRRARARAQPRRARPSRRRRRRARSDERERRLVLDVLDLDALRAPDEDGVRVRRVHDVGDLDPELSASAMCSSAESTRTARWFRSGRSGSPGSPWWSSTNAPPTSTRGAPAGPGARRSRAARTPPAVSLGRRDESATWSRSYSTSVVLRRARGASPHADVEVRLTRARPLDLELELAERGARS